MFKKSFKCTSVHTANIITFYRSFVIILFIF